VRFLDGRFEHKTFFATVYSLIINRWGKGVTRLDGARGKKQVWRPPMFEPEVFWVRRSLNCFVFLILATETAFVKNEFVESLHTALALQRHSM